MTDERTIKRRAQVSAGLLARLHLGAKVALVAAVVVLGLAGCRASGTTPASGVAEVPPVVPDGPAPPPACTAAPLAPDTGSSQISLFYTCSGDPFPSNPRTVSRALPAGEDPVQFALGELLKGPTGGEQDKGFVSYFSPHTAGMLKSVRLTAEGRATVDFADFRAQMNNASTSAGMRQLLQELGRTLFQFPQVKEVEYRLDGSCGAFWEWLQSSCQVIRADQYRTDISQPPGRTIDGCATTPAMTTPFERADLSNVPWLKASPAEAGVSAHLFASPDGGAALHVGTTWPDGRSNKVLWLVSHPSAGPELTVSGRQLSTGETYHETFPAASRGEYPSLINLPSPGCWDLEVRTGEIAGRVVFTAVDLNDFALLVRVARMEPFGEPLAGAKVTVTGLGLQQATDANGWAGPMPVLLVGTERFPYEVEVAKDGFQTCVLTWGSLILSGTGRWWEQSPYRIFVYMPEGEGTVNGDACYGGRTAPQTPGP